MGLKEWLKELQQKSEESEKKRLVDLKRKTELLKAEQDYLVEKNKVDKLKKEGWTL